MKRGIPLRPGTILALCFCATMVLNIPAIILFSYADRLGPCWMPILLAYFALLSFFYVRILRPRELARLRYQLGDEQFFELFPRERKREERQKARKARAERRADPWHEH